MNILHSVSCLGKSSYGLGQICMSLASSQLGANNQIRVLSMCDKEDALWSSDTYGFPKENILVYSKNRPLFINFSYRMLKSAYCGCFDDVDIIHQHSIWCGNSIINRMVNREKKIPYIIAPHGTLSVNPTEKRISKIKKKIALSFYEKQNLVNCSCFHVTSEMEIQDVRDAGYKAPVAYISNGINRSALEKKGDGLAFKVRNSLPKDKKILLYLSRITAKKGLDMLLSAIKNLESNFADWILIIAGNDDGGYQFIIENLIKEYKLSDKIFILGPQFDQSKLDILAAADFFILPSYTEGSPMAILDSLAAGVPVITTKSSSWEDLDVYRCGFWVDISQNEIEKSLLKMIGINDSDLLLMKDNAKKMIKEKYTWDTITHETFELYNWLLKKGDRPNFIILD